MSKAMLFIDGSNLYSGQYELFGPTSYLDFQQFMTFIEKSLNKNFSRVYFYASYSPKTTQPTEKQKQYLKSEALFYRSVKKMKKLIFFKGYRSPTSGKEKEVDVKLTADLVHLAHTKAFDEIFLMTGDADFLQALFIVHSLKKTVKILCLENKIMYKATYRFPTYIVRITNNRPKYKKTSLVTEMVVPQDKICRKI